MSGKTIYVSKLGDDSDGSSWSKAFRTIQKALDAVPDDKGGHRIIVRPDTYMESMLSTPFKGAKDAYNELIGDVDGRYGSGTVGYVIIDSSDPAKGFKSYDWFGPLKAYKHGWSPEHKEETFSANCWDRWRLSGLYVTGGDGGLMWDLVDKIEPFTVIVEDCVSLGRAFGGGVASCLSRYDEPITFRRCTLWALDWWGDTASAYVRVENPSMPEKPDVIFDDCTMVSPQCALKGGNYGFHTWTRVKVKNSRLIVLNFSQPAGTPSDGIIVSMQNGKYLHVEIEDSILMGYKVFGVKVDKDSEKDIGYDTKGSVLAYIQFQQDVPKGFYRLQQWSVDAFQTLVPPKPKRQVELTENAEFIRKDMCELSPIIWKGKLCHLACVRPATGGTKSDYYLELSSAETGEILAKFAEGYSLASAIVNNDVLYVFASRFEDNNWNDVTLFKSADLINWESKLVLKQENENLFNTSVCECPNGFVMAYESNDPKYPAFTIKFAVSDDLENWKKIPDAIFGTNRYTACPCIRYVSGYYYVLYLENRSPRHYYETYITRSKDLKRWELSSANPVLRPTQVDDCINTSDPEIIEFNGKTYVYYSVGDQLTWMNVKRAVYYAPLKDFFEYWYDQPGIEDCGTFAYQTEERRENA
ncbi:MAG: hypothetical protein ACPL7B_05300 [Candidatus Poribacteria bacterium]